MVDKPHLYILPIAHSYADLGSLRDKIPFDERYEAAVTKFWVTIFHYVESLPPNLLDGLQVYQDSLINASDGIVDKIVDETQTANYEILRWLREKGATIFGTEDASLLLKDCEVSQATVNYSGDKDKTAHLKRLQESSWLLEERDNYIAQRIRKTLPAGKTGLLFIGAIHNVGLLLGNEIRVSTPEEVSRALAEVLRDSYYNLGKEKK